jgi:hypothetical protein
MRPYRARFGGQGVFFAFQSWAGCITNIFGFDFRQAQAAEPYVSLTIAVLAMNAALYSRSRTPRRQPFVDLDRRLSVVRFSDQRFALDAGIKPVRSFAMIDGGLSHALFKRRNGEFIAGMGHLVNSLSG